MINKIKPQKRKITICLFFAVFYSACQIIGQKYYSDVIKRVDASPIDILSDILTFLTLLVISFFVSYVVISIVTYIKEKSSESNSVGRLSHKKKLILIAAILLICWFPYLIAFFPGANNLDTIRQIAMTFKLPTMAADRIITDGISVIYSAHHPVFLSWIFGFFYRLGAWLGDVGIGIFIYLLIQDIAYAITFSWSVLKLEKYNTPVIIRRLILFIYAFHPLVTFSTFTMISDGPFALTLVILAVIVFEIIQTGGKYLEATKHLLFFISVMFSASLCKKTGVFIVIVLCIILIFAYRKQFKYWLFSGLCVVILFCAGFEGIVYNGLNIRTGGLQEALSIPFQQTARFFRDYDGVIPEEEINTVNKVLDANVIAERYYAPKSDAVKSTYKEDASTHDIKEYFKVWAKEFFRAPGIYFDAYFYQTSRYFFTGHTETKYGYFDSRTLNDYYEKFEDAIYKKNPDIAPIDKGVLETYDYQIPKELIKFRNYCQKIFAILSGMPLLGGFFTVGFCFQMVILIGLSLIYKKQYFKLIPLSISVLIIISCLISPVNGSYRYSIPVFFMLPFIVGTVFSREIGIKER